jgi:hypothetical protein
MEAQPIPQGLFPEDLKFLESATAESRPRNAYVRVQAKAGILAKVPYLGTFETARKSDDVVTYNYAEPFRALAGAFFATIFPNATPVTSEEPAPQSELTVQLTLAKSTYDLEAEEFRQYLTLRIIGRTGTVIYQTVSFVSMEGDLRADPSLIERALLKNFQQLGAEVAAAYQQIISDLEFDHLDFAELERLLLGSATRQGRSSSQNSDVNGNQYAVVIGISDYRSAKIPDLRSAHLDARDFFATINDPRNTLNFRSDRVVLLTDEAATARNIRSALSRWLVRRVTRNDTAVIYFAGHGIYDEDLSRGTTRKEKYFLPVDFEVDGRTYSSGLPMEEITEYFERLEARNIIMIFDACRSGAADLGDRTDELRRLSRTGSGRSVNAILAAAKSTQESIDLSRNGLFTHFLLAGMRGAADTNSDQVVSVTEIGAYVSERVPPEARRRRNVNQEPVLKVSDHEAAERLGLTEF